MRLATSILLLFLPLLCRAAVSAPLCLTAVIATNTPPEVPESTNAPLALTATMFPIEVLGPTGSTASFSIAVTNGSMADKLYIRLHSPGENKVEVRLNGGTWVALNATNVTMDTRTLALWGLPGIQHTVDLEVSTSYWTLLDAPLENEIVFKFTDQDGLTIGYRILELNLRAGSTNLIAASQFTYDDPSTWVPPSTNSVDIAAGQTAWYTLPISEGGVPLLSNCTSCHFENGKDLKLLNYSANSIIQRSIFHGVPAVTATNIASYILSLNYPYQAKGRPWNPPYQPAPNMDTNTGYGWFAGGGLEAVLEHDTNTLSYIFTGSITTNSINFTNTLNAREIPLAMQFPDWNHWLPRKHPLDATYPLAATNAYLTIYTTMRSNIVGKTAFEIAYIVNAQKSNWDRNGSRAGITKPVSATDMFHWRVVKTAELMLEADGDVQDQGVELFGVLSDDRRWSHGDIFRLGPHVLGSPKIDTFNAESMQWYQLQLVLNSGNRENGGIVPIDWGYQIALNRSAWNNDVDYPFYGAQLVNQIKAGEVVSNGLGPYDANGWDMYKVNLGYMVGKAVLYNQIELATRQKITGALLTAWLDQSEQWTYAEYDSAGYITSGVSNTLASITSLYTTLGVDPNVMSRFAAFRTYLFP